jgi:hypothetical protein
MVSGVSVSPLELIPLIDIAADGRRSLKNEGWHLKTGKKSKGGKERAEIAQRKSKKGGERYSLRSLQRIS